MGQKLRKSSRNPSFPPCGMSTPPNTPVPGLTTLNTLNDSLISSRTSAQPCTKVPICYNGMIKFTPKLPFPSMITTPSIHPSFDWPHSPSERASGSTQLFCHHALSKQTIRWSRRQVSKNTTYAHYTDIERCDNNAVITTISCCSPKKCLTSSASKYVSKTKFLHFSDLWARFSWA